LKTNAPKIDPVQQDAVQAFQPVESDEKPPETPNQPEFRTLPFKDLFRFSPKSDKTLVWLGVVMAVLGGAVAPLMALIFG
jgi:hypothetical protein